jgi:hypothetical protein
MALPFVTRKREPKSESLIFLLCQLLFGAWLSDGDKAFWKFIETGIGVPFGTHKRFRMAFTKQVQFAKHGWIGGVAQADRRGIIPEKGSFPFIRRKTCFRGRVI